jgi:hypothetical protein
MRIKSLVYSTTDFDEFCFVLLLVVICGTAGWSAIEVHWMSRFSACDVEYCELAARGLLFVPPVSREPF